jgi:hypothetical protein
MSMAFGRWLQKKQRAGDTHVTPAVVAVTILAFSQLSMTGVYPSLAVNIDDPS